MRIDKLTSQLQNALSDAQSLAVGRDHTQIAPRAFVAGAARSTGRQRQPTATESAF